VWVRSGSVLSSRICCGLCGVVVIRSGKWSARWAKRCLGSGGTCVNQAGSRRSRGGAGRIICRWRNVRRSHAESRPASRHGRSPGALADRRRRYRGRLPAMVAAMRTGHWSPTRPRSIGRGARNRPNWPRTRSYGVWSPTSWTMIGHRSRSPSGCGGSFSMTPRCGSLTNRSTVISICRRGKCLTPACSIVCGVGVSIRRPRGKKRSHGRGQIRNMVSIRERPTEADTRQVAGH
jgi:hypothetical protein